MKTYCCECLCSLKKEEPAPLVHRTDLLETLMVCNVLLEVPKYSMANLPMMPRLVICPQHPSQLLFLHLLQMMLQLPLLSFIAQLMYSSKMT